MATTLTIGEFKARLPEALALVAKGESVTVTYGRNKRPVAVLAPPPRAPRRQPGAWKGLLTYAHPDEPLLPLPPEHSGVSPSTTDPLDA